MEELEPDNKIYTMVYVIKHSRLLKTEIFFFLVRSEILYLSNVSFDKCALFYEI